MDQLSKRLQIYLNGYQFLIAIQVNLQSLEWLSIFDSNSIEECDYGGLAIYLEKSLIESGQPGLNADTSIEDVARSLAGLAAGDGALAGQGYERLVTRWRRIAAFENAS